MIRMSEKAETEPGNFRLKISGSLLSKLLHERFKQTGYCGGLLYGDVVSATKTEITDAQHITTSESVARIQDYFPLTKRYIFSSAKQTNKEAWTNDTPALPLSSCVGMYRIRNSPGFLSLLEKSMHKRLCKELLSKDPTKCDGYIVTLLVTYRADEEASCWSWIIEAFVCHKSVFSTIKFEVTNLQGSVSGLYISNLNAVRHMQSMSIDTILQSFQSSLTEDTGGIKVVEASRKVTQDLITELDTRFDNLEKRERILDKMLDENSVLLGEMQVLQAKKEAVKSHHQDRSSAEEELVQWVLRDPVVQDNLSNRKEDEEPPEKDITQRETQYQAQKRRSMEDIRRRSPVVVLEKLNMASGQCTKLSVERKKSSPKFDVDDCEDPFAMLVSSTKEGLRKDTAELLNNISSAGEMLFESNKNIKKFPDE